MISQFTNKIKCTLEILLGLGPPPIGGDVGVSASVVTGALRFGVVTTVSSISSSKYLFGFILRPLRLVISGSAAVGVAAGIVSLTTTGETNGAAGVLTTAFEVAASNFSPLIFRFVAGIFAVAFVVLADAAAAAAICLAAAALPSSITNSPSDSSSTGESAAAVEAATTTDSTSSFVSAKYTDLLGVTAGGD